jgi:hypothetical protein
MPKKKRVDINIGDLRIRGKYFDFRREERKRLMGLIIVVIMVMSVHVIISGGESESSKAITAQIFLLGIPIVIIYWLVLYLYFIKFKFFCPHCCKVIIAKDFKKCKCPSCNNIKNSFEQLLYYCSVCKLPLKYVDCPHCGKSIDLHKKYDEEIIKSKIYG